MNLRTLLIISFLSAGMINASAQTTTPTPATANQSDSLRVYAGTYTFSGGSPISTFTITVKDGFLYGDAGMGENKLIKQAQADQFKSTSSYGSIITFIRDAATKAVTGLTLAAQGQELSATKAK
ncbi:DUF3471 domain-containing protein [Fibrella forsythiae]|uniref:DUF3471 domain-containing protein n=1 Tax=Fibrella forsythiae TaxID=2817061 RepID=A0ABS3JMA2_9BACT|nr:DUF3471 domain-containing protein [Fibrella forsythiae]MBO0951123.1 DUF3471 domain-containing protein [Fibrella forsythiae]